LFHADMRNDLEKGAPGVRKCGQVGLLWPIAVRSIPCVYAEIVDLEELLRKLISRGSPVQSGAPPPFLSGYAALPLGAVPRCARIVLPTRRSRSRISAFRTNPPAIASTNCPGIILCCCSSARNPQIHSKEKTVTTSDQTYLS